VQVQIIATNICKIAAAHGSICYQLCRFNNFTVVVLRRPRGSGIRWGGVGGGAALGGGARSGNWWRIRNWAGVELERAAGAGTGRDLAGPELVQEPALDWSGAGAGTGAGVAMDWCRSRLERVREPEWSRAGPPA